MISAEPPTGFRGFVCGGQFDLRMDSGFEPLGDTQAFKVRGDLFWKSAIFGSVKHHVL